MTADGGGTGSDGGADADGSAGGATSNGSASGDDGDDAGSGADANGSSERSAGAPRCPHCEAPMYKRHCKYVCPQHGVIIDCSDPFR